LNKTGQLTGPRSCSFKRCESGFARAHSSSNAHSAPKLPAPIDAFSLSWPPWLSRASVRRQVSATFARNSPRTAVRHSGSEPWPE
jgi:hypothetical protein